MIEDLPLCKDPLVAATARQLMLPDKWREELPMLNILKDTGCLDAETMTAFLLYIDDETHVENNKDLFPPVAQKIIDAMAHFTAENEHFIEGTLGQPMDRPAFIIRLTHMILYAEMALLPQMDAEERVDMTYNIMIAVGEAAAEMSKYPFVEARHCKLIDTFISTVTRLTEQVPDATAQQAALRMMHSLAMKNNAVRPLMPDRPDSPAMGLN